MKRILSRRLSLRYRSTLSLSLSLFVSLINVSERRKRKLAKPRGFSCLGDTFPAQVEAAALAILILVCHAAL